MIPVTAIKNVQLFRAPDKIIPPRLRAEVVEDRSGRFKKGDHIITSPLRSIDFDRGLAVTESGTVYLFPQEEFGR